MTVAEHIYAVQNLLNRGRRSDDAPYSNELIYHFMKMARALLLKQKADKKQYVSPYNMQGFCLPLKEDYWVECCDTPQPDCLVLKGCFKIPSAIAGRNNLYVKVFFMNGQEIGMSDISAIRFRRYSISKANKPAWFLENDWLYISGIPYNRLSSVWVKGMFEDPDELEGITTCENDQPCYNHLESDFPIDSELVDAMYKIVLSYLLDIGSRMPNDNVNNAKQTELQQDKEE